MEGTQITVTLPEPLLRATREVAAAREATVQHLIRDALKAEITRHHRKAKSPIRADERMLAMLRARFATDFAYANSWGDLFERLRMHHVVLREAGGGLALYSLANGARLCKASDMGASLNTLARRFKQPFPGDKQANRYIYSSTTHPLETEVVDTDITF